MKNVFDSSDTQELIARINALSDTTIPKWGSMNVGQMLAHCNVAYDMTFDDTIPKAKGFKKWMLKMFVKPIVIGDKPYKKNSRTAPQFIITDRREFAIEKDRLINYINKTQELGASHFEGKDSHSFGPLSSKEWNTMFYKHLDHHLQQFSV